MADDPFVRWRQSVLFGIYHDGVDWSAADVGAWSAWHTGRTTDVLPLSDGTVLIAAQQGGVWRSSPGGEAALCLTDAIAEHQFNRLAFGPTGEQQVFAGGPSLWVTDPTAPIPLLSWRQITSFTQGTVQDILVLANSIVVAADGIWWADIPALGSMAFVWQQALLETGSRRVTTGKFFSLAEGIPNSRGDQLRHFHTIIAGSAGTPGQEGLYVGAWEGNDLVLRRSQLFINGNDETGRFAGTGLAAVASCESDRRRAYASVARPPSPGDDLHAHLDLLLRSADGGTTWRPCGSSVLLDGGQLLDLFTKCDHQSDQQRLHVSPWNADVVCFGWFDACISFDGGDTWELPGCDNATSTYDNNHQHVDVHRVMFPPIPEGPLYPPRLLLVGSDGGALRMTWAQGASLIEGPFASDGSHGDLEAVVLEGNNLFWYRRPSNTLQWRRWGLVSKKATDRACMIRGDFGGDVKNFELVVPEGDQLVHHWRDNSGGTGWHRGQVVASVGVSGPACLIQSNFPKGADHGNFEVVSLEGRDLVHYWHDNSDVTNPWQRGVTITSHAASSACMIQSDFPKGADHGNFELVVLEGEDGVFGRALVHYWRDNSSDGLPWYGPTLITRDVSAAAWLIQADYPRGADHKNFELFVQEGLSLEHWIRDNQSDELPWIRIAKINAPDEKIDGPPVAIQGNYGADDHHGNFELLAAFGGRVVHYYRDATNMAWRRSAELTRHAFHYFTGWNRNIATLICDRLGLSQAVDGMIATATLDNGVVVALSGPGTPWVQVGDGDGSDAAWPASSSSRFPDLLAGNMLVWTHDDTGYPPHGSLGNPGSSPGMQPTTPDILPLASADPNLSPPPNPADGLQGNPIFGPVIAPVFADAGGFVLSMLGAPSVTKGTTQAPLYGLFIDGPFLPPGDSVPAPKAGWRFLANIDVASAKEDDGNNWPISSTASLDGMTVILSANVGANARDLVDHWEMFLLDVQARTVAWMDSTAVGFPKVNSIVPVSTNEAYAATDDGRVLIWNGSQWRYPGSAVAGGTALLSIAVDSSTSPASIFVITPDHVYVSRDGSRTWVSAMQGLPRSLTCSCIHLMRDHNGVSRLHLSTSGRSTWVAENVEPR